MGGIVGSFLVCIVQLCPSNCDTREGGLFATRAGGDGSRDRGYSLVLLAVSAVSLGSLLAVLGQLERNIQATLAIEGLSVLGKEIVLLGFIRMTSARSDTRSYGFALSAISHRGIGRPAPPVERNAPIRGFPAEVASYAYACAQCGYCVDTCTLYQGRGWETSGPRGKWSFLKYVLEGRDDSDQQMTDTFLMCTKCVKCDVVCQLDLPIEPTWGVLRATWSGAWLRDLSAVRDRGFRAHRPEEHLGWTAVGP